MECSPACNCPPGTHTKLEPEDPVRKAVTEWLRVNRVTLWGGYFTLAGGDAEFEQAVDWLYNQFHQVLERVEGMGLQHWPTCKECGISAPDVKQRGKTPMSILCDECAEKMKARRKGAVGKQIK